MTRLRPIVAILLALVLSVTGGTMAAARASGPVGTMVICTGTGPVEVATDSRGQPAGPHHHCPDCALCLAAPLPVADGAVVPGNLSRTFYLPAGGTPPLAILSPPRQARAPPAV